MIATDRAAQIIECGSLPRRTGIAKFLGQAGLILMMCVAVLAPGLTLNPTWPQVRTETLLLILYGAVFGWLVLVGLAKPLRLHAFYAIGVFFTLSVTVSLIYGTLILNHQLSYRDFFEIPKCWLPVLFFTIGYEAELSEKGLKQVLNYLAVAAALVCLYGGAQFLNLGIAAKLNPYYTDFGHNYSGLIRYRRIFATAGNPNALGQLLSWTLVIYVLALLSGVGSRARNICISIACVVTVALTSSRYGLLASALGLMIVMGLSLSSRRRGVKLVGLLMVLAILGPVFASTARSSYWAIDRFQQLANPLQVDSLRGRLDVLWVEAGSYFFSSPWVGHGPAKMLFDSVYTDSEYLDVLKFYGIVGFFAYIGYYLWPLMETLKMLRRVRFLNQELEERLEGNLLVIRAGFTIFCLALFMNIGEFTLYNNVLLAFLWLWAGLAVRAAHFVREVAAQDSIGRILTEPITVRARSFRKRSLRFVGGRLAPLQE
jgi:O-antigen ligase